MDNRVFSVDLQSGYNDLLIVGLSQYDVGVVLEFDVFDGGAAAVFPSGTTAKIQGVRPSGVGFDISCTLSGNVVTVSTVTDMTGEAGSFPVEIRFTASSVDVGTVNFIFQIEKAAHPDGTIDADITRQETFIERLETLETNTVTDSTLSISGRPADAKATGDAVAELKTYILNHGDSLVSGSGAMSLGEEYEGFRLLPSTGVVTATQNARIMVFPIHHNTDITINLYYGSGAQINRCGIGLTNKAIPQNGDSMTNVLLGNTVISDDYVYTFSNTDNYDYCYVYFWTGVGYNGNAKSNVILTEKASFKCLCNYGYIWCTDLDNSSQEHPERYVNVDTYNKTITFGNGVDSNVRVISGDTRINIAGTVIDYSAYITSIPYVHIYYDIKNNAFVLTGGAINQGADITPFDLYIGSIYGNEYNVCLNVYPFYFVNGLKTTHDDFLSKFRNVRSMRIAVMGDSTSSYAGISESTVDGISVTTPRYPAVGTGNDVTSSDQMWWAILNKALRCENTPNISAVAQSSYRLNPNNNSVPPSWNDERISNLGKNGTPTHIIINMGINDGWNAVGSLGAFSYATDITALENESNSTVKGICLTIRKIQHVYPNAKIILLIPKQIASTNQNWHYDTFYQICEMIRKIGEAYGVDQIIDLRECGITLENMSAYSFDGIHENVAGMEVVGKYVAAQMLHYFVN